MIKSSLPLTIVQLFTQNCSQLPLDFTEAAGDADVKSPHKSPPLSAAAVAVAAAAAGAGTTGDAAKSPVRSPSDELDEGL